MPGMDGILPRINLVADLEKVVKQPQAEKSELKNVLKIALFVTKDKQKYVYWMFAFHGEILES